MGKVKPKPCRKCGSTDIKLWECGYTTFNPGGAECRGCGHEVKLKDCGVGPGQHCIDTVARAWNKDKPGIEENRDDLRDEMRVIIGAIERGKIAGWGLKRAKRLCGYDEPEPTPETVRIPAGMIT